MERRALSVFRAGVLLVAAILLTDDCLNGAENQRPPPERLEIIAGPAPSQVVGAPLGPRGILAFEWKRASDGRRRAWGVCVQPNIPGKEVWVEYPPLAEGELVPLLGYIYRVVPGGSSDVIAFHLVPDKEIPRGAAIQPDSLVLPLKRFDWGGWTQLLYEQAYIEAEKNKRPGPYHSPLTNVFVEKIEPSREGDESPVAWLRLAPSANPAVVKSTAQVRRGDVLVIGEVGHPVRNVVPADQKTRVIGWVEVDPKGITGEDLAKHPRVVRPTPIPERKAQ